MGNNVNLIGGSYYAFTPVHAGVPYVDACTGVVCADPCKACNPTTAACDTNMPDGTSCGGSGDACSSGACVSEN
jgi:hypothetical protein